MLFFRIYNFRAHTQKKIDKLGNFCLNLPNMQQKNNQDKKRDLKNVFWMEIPDLKMIQCKKIIAINL